MAVVCLPRGAGCQAKRCCSSSSTWVHGGGRRYRAGAGAGDDLRQVNHDQTGPWDHPRMEKPEHAPPLSISAERP